MAQPESPPKRDRPKGKLSLPAAGPGQNRTTPNSRAIEGKGQTVGPDKPADPNEKAKGSKAEDEKILERIRKYMERCIASEADNRKAAVSDRKFKAGDQWPADILAQRNTDKRPALTNNRMKTFVHQVTNPARENRPQINISPIGERSDKDGAKMFEGLIRAIERDSHADIAYDTALDDAVTSGWGYMRLLTEWKSETSFDQVLVIKRVRNPFTVYLDPDRQEPDGSDGRRGLITEIVPQDQFEKEFPRAQLIPFNLGGQGEKYREWITKDGIRVAEYYEVDEEPAELVRLSSGWEGYRDDVDEVTERRIKNGAVEITDSRQSNRRCVKYYKVTAIEILERNEWIGKWIPIIEVIGDEIDIEGKVIKSGIIRDAKDAQRQYNYWCSAETELVALAPRAPYIMEEGQLEGHEREWKTANTRSRPVLTYKGTSLDGHPAPPPQRVQQVEVPAGVVAAKQGAAQDMMATTGIRFDSTLGERMHDESGKALRELSRKTDIGAFHYYDNFRRSLEFLGKQLVDAIPKLYTRRQVVTILREDQRSTSGGPTEQTVTLDPNLPSAYRESKAGEGMMRYFNPTFGEYGVTVDIGPSYATKRQEAAESMMEFVKAMPQTAQLVMDLIASEMDWPGAEKIANRLAKAIPAQLLTADMKDIPPQIQALIQNLEQQSKQLQGQLQAAMKELQDKHADREVALEKISSDFEVKLLSMLVKSEDAAKKLALEQAKFVAEAFMGELRTAGAQSHERTMAHEGRAAEAEATERAAEREAEKPKGDE
jgi:hypothetical protein